MSVSVSLHGIRHRYRPDGPDVLRDVTLEVASGTLTTVVGPSGCGKSTMLGVVAGIERHRAGTVRFGERVVDDVPATSRGVGMVLQTPHLFPHLSVGENVAFGLAARGVSRRARAADAERWLARVGLDGTAGRRPRTLSGGQQQRVALVRALAVEPDVLLLDEPLANLDPRVREHLQDLIRDLVADTGVTALMVTHDRTEAASMGDRMAVMLDGRIVSEGSASEVFARPRHRAVAEFLGVRTFVSGTIVPGGLRTAGGVLRVPRAEGRGGEATFGIRPEHVRLAARGETNTVACTITRTRYRGEHWEFAAETAIGTVVGRSAERVEGGAEGHVAFPEEALFPVADGDGTVPET